MGVLSDHEREEDDKGGVIDNPRRRFVEPCTQKANFGRVRSGQLGAKKRLERSRLRLRALLVGPPGGGGSRLTRLVIGGDRLLEEARGDRMCQEALQELKTAVKASGEHKQKVIIHVAVDGLKIRDEKSGVRRCQYHIT